MTFNILLFCLSALVFVLASTGSPCESVEGKWYNQIGSELILSKTGDGKLIGEFRTAVERYEGAAGQSHAVVRGVSKKDPFSHVLGFSAIFNGGSSVATWTGQCQKCGDEELLHTTWILRGQSDKCSDQWKAVMINEDNFWRTPSVPGPRKHMGQHTPKRPEPVYQAAEETKPSYKKLSEELKGKWFTSDGTQLDVTEVSNGTITGTMRNEESKVVAISGNVNEGNANGVFAFSGVRDDRNAINVWVGQLHRCPGDKAAILQTSSLRFQGTPTCEGRPGQAGFKRMKFTRNPPTKSSDDGTWSSFSNFANKVSGFFSSLVGK